MRHQPWVWVLLAMVASVMLLATTNLMCQEIASVPFLWILPLSLYLLSFIICFDRPKWYQRHLFAPLLALSSMAALAIVCLNVYAGFSVQIAGLATVCFAVCMTCHGELERLKPQPKQLTSFYLLVSLGGSLGGLFVGLVAPHLFVGFFEFQIALLICLFVPLTILFFEKRQPLQPATSVLARWSTMFALIVAVMLLFSSLLLFLNPDFQPNLIYRARNEFGLISVMKRDDSLVLINGRIEHGAQFTDPKRSREHQSYYLPGTGVEVGIRGFRDFLESEQQSRGLLVGVVGLGAGGMMTWAAKEDRFVFYEINPEVERIARKYFSYLNESAPMSEVVLGDGRLQLERRSKWLAAIASAGISSEQATNRRRARYEEKIREPFDLLFIDAFSSDSIPLHLLTAECFVTYGDNLKPTGALIVHISNRFIDLQPVVYHAAIEQGLTPILIHKHSIDGSNPSLWVVMTRNKWILNSHWITQYQKPWPENMPTVRWTDANASLAAVLRWSEGIDLKSIRSQIRKK